MKHLRENFAYLLAIILQGEFTVKLTVCPSFASLMCRFASVTTKMPNVYRPFDNPLRVVLPWNHSQFPPFKL